MSLYKIETFDGVKLTYLVDADSEDEAREKVMLGDVEFDQSEEIENEIQSVEEVDVDYFQDEEEDY